jgi:hypothetical protein
MPEGNNKNVYYYYLTIISDSYINIPDNTQKMLRFDSISHCANLAYVIGTKAITPPFKKYLCHFGMVSFGTAD